MECDAARNALSAVLDGEASELERAAVEAHLERCEACREFQRGVVELHGLVRVRPAADVPDLTASIMAAVELPQERSARYDWARYALFAVAATQLVLALPALLLGQDAGASVHVARELGSFDVALAAGLLFAAWQPQRASGLLPVAVALAGAIAVTAVADTIAGRAGVAAEAHHVLDLAGVLFLWLVAKVGAVGSRRRPALGLT